MTEPPPWLWYAAIASLAFALVVCGAAWLRLQYWRWRCRVEDRRAQEISLRHWRARFGPDADGRDATDG